MAGLLDQFMLDRYAGQGQGLLGGPPMQLQRVPQPQPQGGGFLDILQSTLGNIGDPQGQRAQQAFDRLMRIKEFGLKERSLEDKPQIIKWQDPATGYERLIEVTVGKPPKDITEQYFKQMGGTPAPAAGGLAPAAGGAPTPPAATPLPAPPPGVNLKEWRDLQTKEASKTAAEAPQVIGSVMNTVQNLDRLKAAALALREHPGIDWASGSLLSPLARSLPGSPAADFADKLEALKSQVGFGVLQDMREHSKTGGALGNVSDAEGKRLENNLAALGLNQKPDSLAKQLDQIAKFVDTSKQRLGMTTMQQYGRYLTPDQLQNVPSPSGPGIPIPPRDPRIAEQTLPGAVPGPVRPLAPGSPGAPWAPGPTMQAPPQINAPAASAAPSRTEIEAELRRRGLIK